MYPLIPVRHFSFWHYARMDSLSLYSNSWCLNGVLVGIRDFYSLGRLVINLFQWYSLAVGGVDCHLLW